jgi:hypothetical protein
VLTLYTMPSYSDPIDRILRTEGLLRKLTPDDVLDRELWRTIRDADDATLAGGRGVGDVKIFEIFRGALLYALDDLDGAHRFFQDAPGDLAGYWHGMLHRREPDFDNARYWFRRAGALPFFAELHGRAANHSPDMAKQPSWDPYLFTGQCEQARHGETETLNELAALQRAEFEVAFDYTWRQCRIA